MVVAVTVLGPGVAFHDDPHIARAIRPSGPKLIRE